MSSIDKLIADIQGVTGKIQKRAMSNKARRAELQAALGEKAKELDNTVRLLHDCTTKGTESSQNLQQVHAEVEALRAQLDQSGTASKRQLEAAQDQLKILKAETQDILTQMEEDDESKRVPVDPMADEADAAATCSKTPASHEKWVGQTVTGVLATGQTKGNSITGTVLNCFGEKPEADGTMHETVKVKPTGQARLVWVSSLQLLEK